MDRLAVKRKLLTDLKGYASKGAAEDMAQRHGVAKKIAGPAEPVVADRTETASAPLDEVDPAALEQLLAACGVPGEDENKPAV